LSQETTDIALSCSVKYISLLWSVYAWLVSVTDRQTDRWKDGLMDRFYDNKCRASLRFAAKNSSYVDCIRWQPWKSSWSLHYRWSVVTAA